MFILHIEVLKQNVEEIKFRIFISQAVNNFTCLSKDIVIAFKP